MADTNNKRDRSNDIALIAGAYKKSRQTGNIERMSAGAKTQLACAMRRTAVDAAIDDALDQLVCGAVELAHRAAVDPFTEWTMNISVALPHHVVVHCGSHGIDRPTILSESLANLLDHATSGQTTSCQLPGWGVRSSTSRWVGHHIWRQLQVRWLDMCVDPRLHVRSVKLDLDQPREPHQHMPAVFLITATLVGGAPVSE